MINKNRKKKRYKGVVYYFIDGYLYEINEDKSIGNKYAKYKNKKVIII